MSIQLQVDSYLEKVDGSKYALVQVAAKRARQINDYYHHLGEGMNYEDFPPPLIESHSKNYLTLALEEIYSKHTGQTVEQIHDDMERDRFFTAEEAREYGLIDHVMTDRDTLLPAGGSPNGAD